MYTMLSKVTASYELASILYHADTEVVLIFEIANREQMKFNHVLQILQYSQ